MYKRQIVTSIGAVDIYWAQLVSIALIIFLTYVNTKGIQGGKIIQTTFTVIKLISLFGLIIFGFIVAAKAEIWNANWTDAWSMVSRDANGAVIGGVTGSAIPVSYTHLDVYKRQDRYRHYDAHHGYVSFGNFYSDCIIGSRYREG